MYRDLVFWERFGEDVRHHILSGAVLDVNVSIGNGLMNKVKVYVDMFGTSVIVVVCSEMKGGLVVTIKGGRSGRWSEQWLNESLKPNALLGGMHGCHVFGLGCGQSD
jgi:hypothetical protein